MEEMKSKAGDQPRPCNLEPETCNLELGTLNLEL
jgi:hypothetical protein